MKRLESIFCANLYFILNWDNEVRFWNSEVKINPGTNKSIGISILHKMSEQLCKAISENIKESLKRKFSKVEE